MISSFRGIKRQTRNIQKILFKTRLDFIKPSDGKLVKKKNLKKWSEAVCKKKKRLL